MNNQISKEEKKVARRMREHEFAFDASALAGFESLLAAEDAVSGKVAPAVSPTAASGSSSRRFWVLVLALLVGAGAGMTVWYCQDDEAVVTAEHPSAAAAEPAAITDTGEARGEAPAVAGTDPASIQNTAPAPRRPEKKQEPVSALSGPAFTPVAQPTTLARRPLPMPRAPGVGQAPPRPMPISGETTDDQVVFRGRAVAPLPSVSYRVVYTSVLPAAPLRMPREKGWRP